MNVNPLTRASTSVHVIFNVIARQTHSLSRAEQLPSLNRRNWAEKRILRLCLAKAIYSKASSSPSVMQTPSSPPVSLHRLQEHVMQHLITDGFNPFPESLPPASVSLRGFPRDHVSTPGLPSRLDALNPASPVVPVARMDPNSLDCG